MKKIISLLVVVILLCSTIVAFGEPSLDEVINSTENQVQAQEDVSKTDTNEQEAVSKPDTYNENKSFIEGLQGSANVSAEVEGVSNITSGAKTVVAFIVQVLSYLITILLALRIVLDLAFIALPFTRAFLGNGYMGNAQAGAGGLSNSLGMNGAGMNRIGGMGGMGMQGNMAMTSPQQQPNASGRVQLVSNAALNSVAGENTVGTDGKAVSPFKLYIKDMTVVLVIVPILITLAVTGALTNLGFTMAQLLVDGISKIGQMI
jgi:hypothetical protein